MQSFFFAYTDWCAHHLFLLLVLSVTSIWGTGKSWTKWWLTVEVSEGGRREFWSGWIWFFGNVFLTVGMFAFNITFIVFLLKANVPGHP